MKKTSLVWCLAGLVCASATYAASPAPQIQHGLEIRVQVRTAEQIAAFYEARGFSVAALKRISQHCFIGVAVFNHTNDVVWLETDRWRVVPTATPGETLVPLQAGYWREIWQEIGLAKAKQATFRWTQLPEVRDLQPQEPVGGNIAIPGRSGTLSLDLVLVTGQDREGREIRRRFSGLRCG